MSAEKLAKRYAKAVISIAEEKNELKNISDDAEILSQLASNVDAMNILTHPKISVDDKASHLKKFFKSTKSTMTVQNALMLMLKKNQVEILKDFAEQLITLSDEKLNRARIKITVPADKDVHYADKIQKLLAKKTNNEIIVETVVDPVIIGGIVVRHGSYVFDGSVKNKLDSLTGSFL